MSDEQKSSEAANANQPSEGTGGATPASLDSVVDEAAAVASGASSPGSGESQETATRTTITASDVLQALPDDQRAVLESDIQRRITSGNARLQGELEALRAQETTSSADPARDPSQNQGTEQQPLTPEQVEALVERRLAEERQQSSAESEAKARIASLFAKAQKAGAWPDDFQSKLAQHLAGDGGKTLASLIDLQDGAAVAALQAIATEAGVGTTRPQAPKSKFGYTGENPIGAPTDKNGPIIPDGMKPENLPAHAQAGVALAKLKEEQGW